MNQPVELFLIRDPGGVLEDQIITGRDSLKMALEVGFIDITHDLAAFDRAEERDIMREQSGYYGGF